MTGEDSVTVETGTGQREPFQFAPPAVRVALGQKLPGSGSQATTQLRAFRDRGSWIRLLIRTFVILYGWGVTIQACQPLKPPSRSHSVENSHERPYADEGLRFSQTADEPEIGLYECQPHTGIGMLGAVV